MFSNNSYRILIVESREAEAESGRDEPPDDSNVIVTVVPRSPI